MQQEVRALKEHLQRELEESVVEYAGGIFGCGLVNDRSWSAQVVLSPAGSSFADHGHEGDEWFFVMRGRYTVIVDGTPHELREGERLRIPSGASHYCDHVPVDSTTLCVLQGSNSGYPGTPPSLHWRAREALRGE